MTHTLLITSTWSSSNTMSNGIAYRNGDVVACSGGTCSLHAQEQATLPPTHSLHCRSRSHLWKRLQLWRLRQHSFHHIAQLDLCSRLCAGAAIHAHVSSTDGGLHTSSACGALQSMGKKGVEAGGCLCVCAYVIDDMGVQLW